MSTPNNGFVLADPHLTDYDTLLENIRGLKEGNPVETPIYDFKSCSRIGYRLKVSPFNCSTYSS